MVKCKRLLEQKNIPDAVRRLRTEELDTPLLRLVLHVDYYLVEKRT